jgi:lipoate-protein ligase A
MKIVEEYTLPDADLIHNASGFSRHLVWLPDRTIVVIGNGSDPDAELHTESIAQDGIEVVRRGTGGCAVILSPEMFVASFAIYGRGSTDSVRYFRLFNRIVIDALGSLGVEDVSHEGRSDIAVSGRKIAGTAIYRNRNLIFYHAIINVAGDTELMERYLKIPPRMPDYRKGRSHSDFVTSLAEQGYELSIDEFRRAIDRECRISLSETALSSKIERI